MSIQDDRQKTYLTTDELAQLIKYDARTIRNRLVGSVLIEGRHFVRPFGGRKLLYIWEAIEADMNRVAGTLGFGASPAARNVAAKKEDRRQGLKWSPLEDKYLNESWGTISIHEMSKLLGRPQASIYERAERLGLKRPNAWSEGEILLMREQYLTEGAAVMAIRLGRSVSAIKNQAMKMELYHRPPPFRWTEAEDDLLRKLVGQTPLRKIHADHFNSRPGEKTGEFNRTYASVAQRCGAIGITLSREDAARLK